jgi:hypothetical protein
MGGPFCMPKLTEPDIWATFWEGPKDNQARPREAKEISACDLACARLTLSPQLRNDLITCQRTVPTISDFRRWRNRTTIRSGR